VLVHFLDAVHTRIADVFATSGLDRFAAADWCWDEAGLPRLVGVDARARAVITRTIEAGSSELFIAELLTARAPEAREPLIYLDRRYRALAELTPTSS